MDLRLFDKCEMFPVHTILEGDADSTSQSSGFFEDSDASPTASIRLASSSHIEMPFGVHQQQETNVVLSANAVVVEIMLPHMSPWARLRCGIATTFENLHGSYSKSMSYDIEAANNNAGYSSTSCIEAACNDSVTGCRDMKEDVLDELCWADTLHDDSSPISAAETADSRRPGQVIEVLHGISFEMQTGKLSAILGASGAGKTSLLDVLSGQPYSGGRVSSGEIRLDGMPASVASNALKEAVGYVKQRCQLLPHLTVLETLQFRASLALPSNMSSERKLEQVMKTMELLDLDTLAHRLVGGGIVAAGLSGGQQRLLAIASQMISMPRILLLDEPTSGLDAFTAEHLCTVLHRLACTQQQAIALTIHQPGPEITRLFDHVLLLSSGHAVYNGPADDIIPYFDGLGYPLPKFTSPYDHYVDLSTLDQRSADLAEESLQRLDYLVQAQRDYSQRYSQVPALPCNGVDNRHTKGQVLPHMLGQNTLGKGSRQLFRRESTISCQSIQSNRPLLSASMSSSRTEVLQQPSSAPECSKPNTWTAKFGILLKRSLRDGTRSYKAFTLRIAQVLALSVLLGLVFLQLGHGVADAQNRTALLFVALSLQPFMAVFETIAKCAGQNALVQNDVGEGMYTKAQFMAAEIVADFPATAGLCLAFAIPQRLLASLSASPSAWCIYIGVTSLHTLVSQMMAMTSLTLTKSPDYAALLANLIFTGWIMTAGYIINIKNLWVGVKWLTWLNPLRYALQATAQEELEGLRFQDDNCGANTSQKACTPTMFGNQYLEGMTFTSLTTEQCIAILCALYACSVCLLFVSLRVKH